MSITVDTKAASERQNAMSKPQGYAEGTPQVDPNAKPTAMADAVKNNTTLTTLYIGSKCSNTPPSRSESLLCRPRDLAVLFIH